MLRGGLLDGRVGQVHGGVLQLCSRPRVPSLEIRVQCLGVRDR